PLPDGGLCCFRVPWIQCRAESDCLAAYVGRAQEAAEDRRIAVFGDAVLGDGTLEERQTRRAGQRPQGESTGAAADPAQLYQRCERLWGKVLETIAVGEHQPRHPRPVEASNP